MDKDISDLIDMCKETGVRSQTSAYKASHSTLTSVQVYIESCLSVSSPEDVLFGVECEGRGFLWDGDFGRICRFLTQLELVTFNKVMNLVPVIHCRMKLFREDQHHGLG